MFGISTLLLGGILAFHPAAFATPAPTSYTRPTTVQFQVSKALNATVNTVWTYIGDWQGWAPEGPTNIIFPLPASNKTRHLKMSNVTQTLLLLDETKHEISYERQLRSADAKVDIVLSADALQTHVQFTAGVTGDVANVNITTFQEELAHDLLILETYAVGFRGGKDLVFRAPCDFVWSHVGNWTSTAWITDAETVTFPSPHTRIIHTKANMTFPEYELETYSNAQPYPTQHFISSVEIGAGFFGIDREIVTFDLRSITDQPEECAVKHSYIALPGRDAPAGLEGMVKRAFEQPGGMYERAMAFFADSYKESKGAGNA